MRLTYHSLTLHLITPFRLSYGVSETREAHWIRLQDDQGWGEAAIPPYYGVETAAMRAVWDAAALKTEPFPEHVAGIPTAFCRAVCRSGGGYRDRPGES